MAIRKILLGTAAAAFVAAPVVAQASLDRASAPISGEALGEEGSPSGVLIGIFAAAAIVAGIVIASSDDDDEPLSP